jgi:hypothetical protein
MKVSIQSIVNNIEIVVILFQHIVKTELTLCKTNNYAVWIEPSYNPLKPKLL